MRWPVILCKVASLSIVPRAHSTRALGLHRLRRVRAQGLDRALVLPTIPPTVFVRWATPSSAEGSRREAVATPLLSGRKEQRLVVRSRGTAVSSRSELELGVSPCADPVLRLAGGLGALTLIALCALRSVDSGSSRGRSDRRSPCVRRLLVSLL